MQYTWETPISTLAGVGEKRSQLYQKLRIETLGDLLEHYPRRYLDYSLPVLVRETSLGETAVVELTMLSIESPLRLRGGRTLYQALGVDAENQKMHLAYFNNPYALRMVSLGKAYRFMGKISGSSRKREMYSPTFIPADDPVELRPVYGKTQGLSDYTITKNVQSAYDALKNQIPETLPDDFRQKYQLCRRDYAIKSIHFPRSEYESKVAKHRLSFEELLVFQLALRTLRLKKSFATQIVLPKNLEQLEEVTLPFTLTSAQQRTLLECLEDLSSGQIMNRIIQGDVGSGKTIVAILLAFMMAKSGWQTALMAPTEILAFQHFQNFEKLLSPLGIHSTLVTSPMGAKERRLADEKIQSGQTQIAIGTHALLSEKRVFQRLGLVVTDEQHRFGVRQRAVLSEKGENPHTLVMSATPIPRTLSLVLYGDLDISIIDELPPGRKKIHTYLIDGKKRDRALGFFRKHLDEGRQGYIVCPLVEEGEGDMQTLKSVEQYSGELQKNQLKGYRVGFLHGKMKAKGKAKIMEDFSNGTLQVLVSTTVIEVGIDVPNAVLMLVENAERFGLSQLHQLRGRIGRGQETSYCILLSDSRSPKTRERLEILTKTQNGFTLAEEDLRLRGPGDFLGERQHGLPFFKAADFGADARLLKETTEIASALLENGTLYEKAFQPLLLETEKLLSQLGNSFMN